MSMTNFPTLSWDEFMEFSWRDRLNLIRRLPKNMSKPWDWAIRHEICFDLPCAMYLGKWQLDAERNPELWGLE